MTLYQPATAPSGDAELLAALRRGDENVFADLVERHSAAMLRIARQYVPSSAIAEEVVQETWLGVLRGLDRFEDSTSLKAWIFRILATTARTRGGRERRSVPYSTLASAPGASVDSSRFLPADDPEWPGHWAAPPPSLGSFAEALLDPELAAVLESSIADLPELERLVVTLRDAEGWSAEDVCELLGLSEGHQRVLLHRGRSRVRSALESYAEAAAA
jgi:RNA polymerase sigma-70 factor (ECF subfamily)